MSFRSLPLILIGTALEAAQPDVPAELLALMDTPIQVASTQPEHLLSSPSTVTILDRAFISRYNIQTLGDLLNTVVGLEVVDTNVNQDVVTARGVLQDYYADKVLFLLDGTPVWDAITGSGKTALYRIDPRDVERVEVLRGPASVLYGSNAYTGAINIVLRRTWDSEGELRVASGRRGSQEIGGRLSGSLGELGFMASANRQDFCGKPQVLTGEDGITIPFRDNPEIRSGLLKLYHGGHSLLLSAFRRTEAELGGIIKASVGMGREWLEFGHLAAYTYTGRAGGLGLQAKAVFDRTYRNAYVTQDATRNDHYDGYRQSLGLRMDSPLNPRLNLEWGAEAERRHATQGTNRSSDEPGGIVIESIGLEGKSVTEGSAFLQGNWRGNGLEVVAGSRYTHNTLAGSNLSSRLSMVRPLGEGHALKFIAGQSFRAPTIFECYSRVPGIISGNPGLKPEKATSLELAHVGTLSSCLIQTTIYHAWYTHKIERIGPDPLTGSSTFGNGGTFQADALELELQWQGQGGWRGMSNLDWLLHTDKGDRIGDATDSGHYNYKYPPRFHLRSALSWSKDGFQASGLASLSGPSQGPLARIPSQWTASLNVAYTHVFGGSRMEHDVSLQNAHDQNLLFASYTRRAVNAIPQDNLGRRWTYTLKTQF